MCLMTANLMQIFASAHAYHNKFACNLTQQMDSPENPPTSIEVARTLLWPAHSYSSKVSVSPSTSTSSSSRFAFCPAGFPLFCLFRHRSTCWFNSSGVPDSLSLQTGQDASSAFLFRFLTRILACAKKTATRILLQFRDSVATRALFHIDPVIYSYRFK